MHPNPQPSEIMFSPLCVPLFGERLRGGWRQTLDAASQSFVRPPPLVALGHLLDWGDGAVSAMHIGRHFQYNVLDGEVTHPMVHRLAAISSDRESSGNAARKLADLMDTCGFGDLISEGEGRLVTHMVLPSRLIEMLQTKFPTKFATLLGAAESKLQTFWSRFRAHPDFQKHVASFPALAHLQEHDWSKMVPLTFHEDAGPYIKGASVNIISFTGLLGRGPEKTSQYLVASYIKEGVADHADVVAMWAPILADMQKLVTEGIGGYRFLLLFMKADLEVRSNSWGLSSYNGTHPCTECICNRADIPWTELSGEAKWRKLPPLTKTTYFARARSPLHPVLGSPFAWRWFCPLDLMHIADCNGITNIAAGSVIKPLVFGEHSMGRTQEQRLATLNKKLSEFYAERPGHSRMPKLRVGNLVSNGWSVLCGTTVKAANTRGLSPFLVSLAEAYHADEGDEYTRLVTRLVRCLNRIYVLLYTADVFLSPQELAEFRRPLLRFGATSQQLREIARGRGAAEWKLVPKTHMFMHMSDLANLLNPRWVQNYSEESQVGSTTLVWSRTARGRYRKAAQRMVLLKRLVALVVRLEGGL